MKKIIYYLLPTIILLLGSCIDRDDAFCGEGSATFTVNMISDITEVKSRALTDEEQNHLKEICFIQIYNADNKLIRNYQGLANLPEELKLVSGDYTVVVTAGEPVSSSFTQKYYEGKKAFTITRGDKTQVDVKCNIANTLVSITFDESLQNSFNFYSVNVAANENVKLTFNTENRGAIGYFTLPVNSNLTCSFVGKTTTDQDYAQENVILDVKPATHYKLVYKLSADDNNGGASVDLIVDEVPLETNEEEIVIYQRPKITLTNKLGESIDTNLIADLDVDAIDSFIFTVNTSCPVASANLSCANFIDFGLDSNSLDIYSMSSAEIAALALKGINVVRRGVIDGPASWTIELSEALVQKLTASVGNYAISLAVGDSFNNTTTTNFRILVTTDFPIMTSKIDIATVWTNKATIAASVKSAAFTEFAFRYKKVSATDWIRVPAVVNGNVATAKLINLDPNTEYEYQAMDGESVSDLIFSFTTDALLQPQNAGFESWSKPGKPWLLYGDGESMWWDSGNHGSATMNKNVTVSSETYKNSGTFSAQLSSQFVGLGIIGKFAAGNAFVGQYLKTDGTDGILGFGRPFTSRPKSLKGFIRYVPGTVTYSDVPAGIDFPKGSIDIGTIYIALGDWTGESYDGVTWPVVVKTKASQRQLFDPNGPSVIAYGAQDWIAATAGDGMIEFEIPIEYRTLDRKPTHIILVASASKYGDYFSGGNSIMWIDDLELIYE